MKVAYWYNNKDIRIKNAPIPKPKRKEMLVKVISCGICGSDIVEWYRLPRAPLVQGHEIGAEVIAVGSSVKKYKPKREQRDLSKITNPDEKSIAALMNVYENTLDKAETFYEKFEKLENNGETGELQSILSDLEKGFEADKNVVESVMFSDKTKYMKYSFEDYFSKTVSDFIKEAKKFLDDAGNKKMKERDFNGGYDDVVRYYNNMINAYNSSISTLNSYQAY